MKSLNIKKKFSLFVILFIINITVSFQDLKIFPIKFNSISNQLDNFFIELEKVDEDDKTKCKKWIPSLSNPLLMVTSDINTTIAKTMDSVNILFPVFQEEIPITFLDEYVFLEKYPLTIGKMRKDTFKYCYLGLLNRILDYPININQTFLNKINKQYIDKKIFSFDKWKINGNDISSNFFFGDNHQNFTSKTNDGILGTCKADRVDSYWGCIFNNMIYNNNTIDLKQNNTELPYKIYFSSENFNIIFPLSFQEKFEIITNNSCKYTTDIEQKISNLSCTDFFIDNDFVSLTLSDDNMDITIEIDNLYRFSEHVDEGKNQTRITYIDGIDYFILPLSMFKNFHVNFNAEDNLISFYTTDKNILKLKNNNNNNQREEKKSSKGLKAFIAILIILIILVLGYAIFWFFKRRKGNINKSINKYNKFEDEENFKDMNEKKVF